MVVFNFYKPAKIEIKDNTKTPVDASMVIENGEHDIYSNGEKFAHLSYLKAIQKKQTLELEKIDINFLKNNGTLNSKKAVFKEGIVSFLSEVNGFFPEKKVKVLIDPPCLLKNKKIFGENTINLSFPTFKLSGKKFVFDINNSFLKLKSKTELLSEDIKINSDYGVSDFKEKIKSFFLYNASLFEKKNKIKVKADLIKHLVDFNKMFFFGKCLVKTGEISLFFNEGYMNYESKNSSIVIRGLFNFVSNDFSGKGSDGYFHNGYFQTRYIQTVFNSYVFSGVNNLFEQKNSLVYGYNPYLYSLKTDRKIKGESYTLKNKELRILNPVLKDRDILLLSSLCIVNNKQEAFFPEKVYGIFDQYEFKGNSAVFKKDKSTVVKGEVISLQKQNDRIKGDLISFYSNNNMRIENNVVATKEMRNETIGKLLSNYMEIVNSGEKVYIKDNVRIINEKLFAKPETAIIFKNYAIFFNCNFKVEGSYSGFARIIVLNFKSRYSYLFYSNVKDKNGNTLKGDKLTLDNVTDKIFIEKTNKKSQVEVKIKI
ncbi:hypothetical protein TTHT_0733 [Thermotomaculum hydrothermale]|uniref:Uncharacterized protein n=1 Tax=Thermotomaculum hydrothermale TaxID=981385 RepID=A0A7R6PLI5_9BACT|nr:hypothetical protein TTHT_0733 [Thermotomaculum hydrothermale]